MIHYLSYPFITSIFPNTPYIPYISPNNNINPINSCHTAFHGINTTVKKTIEIINAFNII